ncbi:hypothetical protein AADZ91_18345 [Colwelliaceae bacterium 6441]
MSNINHSRPYLRFIDNLTKELNKDHRVVTKQETIEPDFKLKYTNRFNKIELSEKEWELLGDLFKNISLYFLLTIDVVDTIGKKSKKGNKAKEQREDCYLKMVAISYELFLIKFIAKSEGRNNGLQEFIDCLKVVLEKNSQYETWHLLTESVFDDALKQVASTIAEVNA